MLLSDIQNINDIHYSIYNTVYCFDIFRSHSNKKGCDWLHTEKVPLNCDPICAGWHYPYCIISNPRAFLLNNPRNLLVTGTHLATNSKNLSSKPVSTASLYGNTIRSIDIVIVYWLFSNYSITIIIVIWFDILCDSLMFTHRDKGHILAPTTDIQTQHFPQYMSCSKYCHYQPIPIDVRYPVIT